MNFNTTKFVHDHHATCALPCLVPAEEEIVIIDTFLVAVVHDIFEKPICALWQFRASFVSRFFPFLPCTMVTVASL